MFAGIFTGKRLRWRLERSEMTKSSRLLISVRTGQNSLDGAGSVVPDVTPVSG